MNVKINIIQELKCLIRKTYFPGSIFSGLLYPMESSEVNTAEI